jgi:selenocysteine lyase/cysteine desulfurase
VAIDYAGVQGCRITPNIYTSTKELDLLVKAIKEIAA